MIDLDKIAAEVPQLRRGKVWCRACGAERSMGGANGLRDGWPKCCGSTMTIDSPAEQARLAAAAAEAKGYKAGLRKAAEMADDMAAEFGMYADLWKASFQDARRTGSELEAQESVGRLLTWKEARMTLLNQAARLLAFAEKE